MEIGKTMRDDLDEIIALGKEKGVSFFQLNTNGVRIAKEDGYAAHLAKAGVSVAFLQFDGLDNAIYRTLRGTDLLEIIGETGKVLTDIEYGELVITTIGADAMPLIRYRTGDYTRILPPCPCGGVTKRLDTVSRRGREISIEELDSALFRIPELVDYRVSFSGVLTIEAKMRSTGMELEIYSAVQSLYSDMQISVCTSLCQCSDRSMYPGKRYLENKDN